MSDSGRMTVSGTSVRPGPEGGSETPTFYTHAQLPLTLLAMRAPLSAPGLLTSKFKGGQALLLGVKGTVDGQRVLAATQGLPLV